MTAPQLGRCEFSHECLGDDDCPYKAGCTRALIFADRPLPPLPETVKVRDELL